MTAAVSRTDKGLPRLNIPTLRYHPVQARLWYDWKRFVAVPAGRRSGKTMIAMMRTALCAFAAKPWPDGPPRFGLGAPTRPQAKQIWWERAKNMIPKRYIAGKPSESELTITLKHNGAVIAVHGMDRPDRVEGVAYDGFVLDEFANMKSDAWGANVRPALADRGGWGWKIGVPEGRNHFWELCEEYRSQPGYGFYTWPSADILPPEEIEELRRNLDPRTFRQELEASFEEATGRIYYAFNRHYNVREFGLPKNIGTEANPWYGGMDFNVDPMCACWGWEEDSWSFDETGKERKETVVFVWDEYHERNADTLVAANEIKERCENGLTRAKTSYPYQGSRFGAFILHPDPTGQARHTSSVGGTDHDILREKKFRLRSHAAPPPRRDKYNSTNSMFCSGDGRRRIVIHPRCKQTIRALEGLLYKEGTSDPDITKCKGMDHPTDGLAYWIEYRHRARYGVEQFNY